jgi:hypothetical protein
MRLYKMESGRNQNSDTPKPDRPQYYRPAACVIAQQYSSSTFVPFGFNFLKKKFGTHFKYVYFNFS